MHYREALLQLVLIQHDMACLLNPVVYVGFLKHFVIQILMNRSRQTV